MTEYPTHPIAELFPMLPDDELQELAEDIKQRGLIHPIVLDAEGRVIDGRNRLAACGLAEVPPVFARYEGDDPDGYVFAVNISRRHLSKGQRAVLTARWCLVSKQTQRSAAEQAGLTAGRVGQAATVLEHAPDLADAVLGGSRSLDDAYKVAQERKAAASSEAAQLERLDSDAPDLAEKVRAGDLALSEARAAAHTRSVERQRDIEAAQRAAATIVATFQTHVATIIGGHEHGQTDLVSTEMIGHLRVALDLLEVRCAS